MSKEIPNFKWRCLDCPEEMPGTRAGYMKIIKHQKGHHVHLVDADTGEEYGTSLVSLSLHGVILPGDDPRFPAGKIGQPAAIKEGAPVIAEKPETPAPENPKEVLAISRVAPPDVERPEETGQEEEPVSPESDEPEENEPEEAEPHASPKSPPKPEERLELGERGIGTQIVLPPTAWTLFFAAKDNGLLAENETDFDSWLYGCVLKRFELDYRLKLTFSPIGNELEKRG